MKKQWSNVPWLMVVVVACLTGRAWAAECTAVFPGVVQSSGYMLLQIKADARLLSTSGTLSPYITTQNLDAHLQACDGGACIGLDAVAQEGDVHLFPSGPNVTAANSPLAPGAYDRLTLGPSKTLVLVPGEYSFREAVDIKAGAEIRISGEGTVRFYASAGINIGNGAIINDASGDRRLFIFSRQDISIGDGAQVTAVLYSKKRTDIKTAVAITGAITAKEDLVIDAGSTITYDPAAITATDFGGFCTSPVVDSPPTFDCNAIFTGGIQTHGVDSFIGVYDNSGLPPVIFNSGAVLATSRISDAADTGAGLIQCGLGMAQCSASGLPAGFNRVTIPVNASGVDISGVGAVTLGEDGDNRYRDISLDEGSGLSFSALYDEYFIRNLTLADNSVLTLTPGTYWVEGDLKLGLNNRLAIHPAGVVQIYVGDAVELGAGSEINYSETENLADQLLVYSNSSASGKIDLQAGVLAEGYFFTDGQAEFRNGSELTGAVSASRVLLDPDTSITYASGLIDFPQFCQSIPSATAQWPMDEDRWVSAANEVQDSSGNSLDGQAFNGADTSAGICRYGVFDGVDDYIEVPGSALLSGDTALTYAAWIRADSWRGTTQVMAKSVHDGGSGRAQMGLFSDGGVFKARAITDSGWKGVQTTVPVPLGDWTHVAAVFNGDSLILYIDGVEVARKTFASTRLLTNDDPFTIGRRGESDHYYFHGLMDDVAVYTQALSQRQIQKLISVKTLCALPEAVDHYAISYDAAPGITCQATTVTATAHAGGDSDGVVVPPAGHEVNFSGAVGCDFSPPTALFDGINSAVTTQLSCADLGTKNIDLIDADGMTDRRDNTHPEDLPIEFVTAKFEFYDATNASAVIPSQIAGKASDVAPDHADIELRAIYTDPATGVCLPQVVEQTIDVQMGMSCIDPLNCVAGQQLRIAGSSVPGTVPLTFDADGRADIPFSYTDSGLIVMTASVSLVEDLAADPPQQAVQLSGSSNAFVVAPAGLCVEVAAAEQAAADCSVAVPSDASYAGCSMFKRAGEAFGLSVKAVGWQSAGDSDFCRDNAVTPNYRQADIQLSHTLLAPGVGSLGELGVDVLNISTAGETTTSTQSVSEVGVFSITATPPDELLIGQPSYMGQPLAASSSVAIGRFVPFGLHVSAGTALLTDQCNGFSYMDADIGFDVVDAPQIRVTALSADGGVTRNYAGDFWRLGSLLENRNYQNTASAASTSFSSTLESKLATDWSGWDLFDGQAVMTLGADTVNYGRDTLQAPFDAEVALQFSISDLTDDDGICYLQDTDGDGDYSDEAVCQSYRLDNIGGTELRFGRLMVQNAFGPETEALSVGARTEYFNGSAFVVNTDDRCTQLMVNLVNPAEGQSTSGTLVPVGDGSSTMTYSEIALDAGDMNFMLSAPGGGNVGSIRYQLDSPGSASAGVHSQPWLLYDWDADGYFDDDPGEREAAFGSYRGHDRVIFWQENFSR